ncbi:MAG TPA: L,D-transpeptidase [Solirubrobacteraceae bacterium]|nr:L,D-transpeptidase [Solirubrobacteraceae bacterium]
MPLTTPPPPAPTPAPTPAPLVGHMQLKLQHVHGHPRFSLTGERVVVRGVILPYVAGEKITVSFYRNGAKASEKTVSVLPVGNGAGQFHVGYASPRTGLVSVRATHDPSPQLGAFAAKSASVRIVPSIMSQGASGPAVRLLQSELNALSYAVPLNSQFDAATGRAVVAYRKLTGLARVPDTNARMFHLLQQGAGRFHVRYRADGRHVEADLTRQVLAEINPGGKVRRIYTISSGKPSTPTVIGRFRVYSKTPGTNAKGMVDSNYFIRGYAIHGYAEVPNYAASHGCLRVPVPDAPAIYSWVQLGYPVDVYNESGGGSHKVRHNAGP